MRPLNHSRSLRPASSYACHLSEMAAVESSREDVVRFSIEDDTAGKKVTIHDSDPQSYTRGDVRLTLAWIFECQKSAPRRLSAHDFKLMES